jgi:hypothetical protein
MWPSMLILRLRTLWYEARTKGVRVAATSFRVSGGRHARTGISRARTPKGFKPMSIATIKLEAAVPQKQLVDDKFLSQTYGVTRRTIRRWARSGAIPSGCRIAGRRLWRLTDIERHLSGLGGEA